MRATLLSFTRLVLRPHSRALATVWFRRLWRPCLIRLPLAFLDESSDLGYRGAEEDAQEPVGGDLGPVLGALQLERIGLKVQKAGSCASRCY